MFKVQKNCKIRFLSCPEYKKKLVVGKSITTKDSNLNINKASTVNSAKEYLRLRMYYFDMFALVDKFHFNSRNTENVYKSFVNIKKSEMISITSPTALSRSSEVSVASTRGHSSSSMIAWAVSSFQ